MRYYLLEYWENGSRKNVFLVKESCGEQVMSGWGEADIFSRLSLYRIPRSEVVLETPKEVLEHARLFFSPRINIQPHHAEGSLERNVGG